MYNSLTSRRLHGVTYGYPREQYCQIANAQRLYFLSIKCQHCDPITMDRSIRDHGIEQMWDAAPAQPRQKEV